MPNMSFSARGDYGKESSELEKEWTGKTNKKSAVQNLNNFNETV